MAPARRLSVVALFAAVVAYVYRPWGMVRGLPRNTGDPSFVTFTMAWVSHAIAHPSRLFDAPIFWPHTNTLAFSDPLLTLGPVWGAVHWVSGSWTVATGMVAMAMVVLDLAATYALAKRLTGRADAAALAAFAFGLSDFTLANWGHVQLQALAFLPLGFLVLFRVLDRGRARDAFLLAALHGAMAMTTASIALAWAVAAGAVVVAHVALARAQLPRPVWRALAITAVASAALVVPVTRPYTALQRDPHYRRPLAPLASLRAPDLLTPTRRRADGLRFLQLPPTTHHTVENKAFPGVTALLLAGLGLAALVATRPRHRREERGRRDGHDGDRRRHELMLVAVAGGACLVTAMGPDVLGPFSPYRILHDDVPGFAGLRVASRFTMVTVLAVAMLAAHGLAHLAARRRVLGWVAVALVLVELAMPVRWWHLDTDGATLAVYRELARRPAGPVAELPMASFLDARAWSDTEAPRQVYLTLDWHPRVNGYSGFVTPDYAESATFLNRFPDPCSLVQARKLGVRWIVLHTGVVDRVPQLTAADAASRVATLPPDAVTRLGSSYLVDVTRLPSPRC